MPLFNVRPLKTPETKLAEMEQNKAEINEEKVGSLNVSLIRNSNVCLEKFFGNCADWI